MDTILNLAIVQFLMKKKGDTHWLRVYHIGGKGWHVLEMRISHRRKRETLYIGVRLVSQERAPHIYQTSQKRLSIDHYPCRASCANTRRGAQASEQHMRSWSTAWSTSCLKSSKPLDCPVFKNWWAWVLIDEVKLNLYNMLDETRWKETRPFGVCLTFGAMRGAPLVLASPFAMKWEMPPGTRVPIRGKGRLLY
jgi:hypothetical protein